MLPLLMQAEHVCSNPALVCTCKVLQAANLQVMISKTGITLQSPEGDCFSCRRAPSQSADDSAFESDGRRQATAETREQQADGTARRRPGSAAAAAAAAPSSATSAAAARRCCVGACSADEWHRGHAAERVLSASAGGATSARTLAVLPLRMHAVPEWSCGPGVPNDVHSLSCCGMFVYMGLATRNKQLKCCYQVRATHMLPCG